MHGGKILERLTGAELAKGLAKHPYTKALLAATPSMAERKAELKTVTVGDFDDEAPEEKSPAAKQGGTS
jgi:ABC-type oligopeptide transport system ATPase subunit